MDICMYMYICICVDVNVCIHVYIWVCLRICIYVCICVFVCMYVYVYVRRYMDTCGGVRACRCAFYMSTQIICWCNVLPFWRQRGHPGQQHMIKTYIFCYLFHIWFWYCYFVITGRWGWSIPARGAPADVIWQLNALLFMCFPVFLWKIFVKLYLESLVYCYSLYMLDFCISIHCHWEGLRGETCPDIVIIVVCSI